MNSLEWPQHFSHYRSMGIFRFPQGQLTLQPLVRSSPNLNSVQTLWLSLLPERMKKIRLKMGELEWPQGFLHYNPMGAICCHGNQSSNPTLSKTKCSQSPTQMMQMVAEIFMFESVNRLTDRRQLNWYTVSSSCEPPAQVS